jgi:zinc protease
MLRTWIVGCLLIGSPTLSLAQGNSPEAEKKLFQAVESLFGEIRQETLANGLRVYLKPIPGEATVSVLTGYAVGSGDEELDQTGLSHYLEHLMFKGTDKLLPGDIDRKTIRHGGKNNAYTGEDLTVYHFDFAANRWRAGLEIEAERMRHLCIDEKHEFEQEKGAVVSELEGGEDDPWEIERKKILPLLHGPKHPYGHPIIGEREHVQAATAPIIKAHYDRWYHPNNAVLILVGGFEPDAAMKAIHELFDPIPKGNLPERKKSTELPKRKKHVHEELKSRFSTWKLVMGYNTVDIMDEDMPVLDFISAVLATGKTSRLHQLLVEKKEVCFEVSATHFTGRHRGHFSIETELTGEDIKAVEKLILKELKKLAQNGISDEELNRVKRQSLASHLFSLESAHELGDMLMNHLILDPKLENLKAYLPTVLKVTSADVQRVAKKYFIDNHGVSIWSIPQDENKVLHCRDSMHVAHQPSRQGPSKTTVAGASLKTTERVVLPNGLTILLYPNHRLPTVSIGALVKDARWRETQEQAGILRLLGDALDAGTAKRTEKQIATALEDRGATMRLSGDGGLLRILSPDLNVGLDLFFDCLLNPTFPEDRLRLHKEAIIAEIEEEEDKPSLKARTVFQTLVFGKEHPFGRSDNGSLEVMKGLSSADCKKFHTEIFVPNNMILAVVGDFEKEQLLAEIEKLTKDWKQRELPTIPVHELPTVEKRTEKIMTDSHSRQLYVYLGHSGISRNDPDYFKLLVMDHVLGTGPGLTDRLSANLRDRQGLAYSVTATITGNSGVDKQRGAFSGQIGTFPDKYEQVKSGFLKEIERIRKESPTDQEVDDAKQYLLGSIAFKFADTESIVSQLLQIERHKLGFDYLETFRAKIEAVTTKDVFEAAKKHLKPDQLIIVATGPIDEKGKPLAEEPPAKR